MNKEQLLVQIDNTTIQKLRAGKKHRFIDISLFTYQGRIFVRQYSLGKRSWYHAFLKDPYGEIKIDGKVIKVNGIVPNDLNQINPHLNEVILQKFGSLGIDRSISHSPRHMASTMEIIPLLDQSEEMK